MQTNLGKVITEIQRDAAGTSTPDLRADIKSASKCSTPRSPICMRYVPERT